MISITLTAMAAIVFVETLFHDDLLLEKMDNTLFYR